MSMSTHVVGFKPADDEWNKNKAVWEACDDAGIDIPDAILAYFEHEPPGDKPGIEADLGLSCTEWLGDLCSGYEIDISRVPEGVKFIRVYNSF